MTNEHTSQDRSQEAGYLGQNLRLEEPLRKYVYSLESKIDTLGLLRFAVTCAGFTLFREKI